jgi:CheY-like chemotaxis protein
VSEANVMSTAVAKRRGPPPDLSGVAVLVVDALEDALDLYAFVLARGGADVRRARSAEEALARLDGWRPRVVVTGIGDAENDAFALAAMLRARDADTRLVAVTADVQPAARARVIAHGFSACLPMPVHPNDLRWAVAEALIPQ